jgi:hypothetical protein
MLRSQFMITMLGYRSLCGGEKHLCLFKDRTSSLIKVRASFILMENFDVNAAVRRQVSMFVC